NMSKELKLGIEIYDSDNFLSSANLLDNIVFGKVDRKIKNGEQQLRDVVAPLLDQQPELYNNIYSIGLDFNVGPSGRRLSAVQRQKLNLARAVMRRSDFYIFNKPISGLDQQQQGSIIKNILALFALEKRSPGIVWALASESNATYFQRKIKFTGKQISKEGELPVVE
ncbi:MAG: putative ABC transport system ATP-binding protein, partial [Granulosicoccus sp.]